MIINIQPTCSSQVSPLGEKEIVWIHAAPQPDAVSLARRGRPRLACAIRTLPWGTEPKAHIDKILELPT